MMRRTPRCTLFPCTTLFGSSRIDGASTILGKAGRGTRGNGRSFIDVGDGNGHCLAGGEAAVRGTDGDVIDIVSPGIPTPFLLPPHPHLPPPLLQLTINHTTL